MNVAILGASRAARPGVPPMNGASAFSRHGSLVGFPGAAVCGCRLAMVVLWSAAFVMAITCGGPLFAEDERRNGALKCQSSDEGCWRCRKTLLHWPGQDFSYVSADDEEGPLATDRPDFTEASSVVGLGHTQLEFGYTYFRDDEPGIDLSQHSYPELLTRVGVFAEWCEFRIAWNYLHERTAAGGLVTDSDGADDLYLGFKLAVFEQDGWFPELAVTPQMTVPSGARAFTSKEIMPGVNFLYSWEISDLFSIAGSTQGNRALDDTGDFYEEYAQSLTTSLSLTEKVSMYNEVFAFFPHGAVETGPEYYYNGGFTYLANNNLQFDIRAGWGLNERAVDFFTGAGAAVRF